VPEVRRGLDRAAHVLGLTRERLLEMFEAMLLARIVDERQWILNRQGRDRSTSPARDEGSGVGSAFRARSSPHNVPYYRSLAPVLAFGMTSLQACFSRSRPGRRLQRRRQIAAHYGHRARHC